MNIRAVLLCAVCSFVAGCSAAQQAQVMRTLAAVEKSANASGQKADAKPATEAGKKAPAKEMAKIAAPWPDKFIWLPVWKDGFNETELGVPHRQTDLQPMVTPPSALRKEDTIETPLSACEYETKIVRTVLEQALTASMLGLGSASGSNSGNERYLRYEASCFARKLELKPGIAIDQSQKALVPVEVQYGWGYEEVFHGAQEVMTAQVEAAFASFGISAKSRIGSEDIQSEINTLGLASKNPASLNLIKSGDDATRLLKPQGTGKGVPVKVKYLLVGGLQLGDLKILDKPLLTPGKYKITVKLELGKRSKAGGWDRGVFDKKGDPTVRLTMDGLPSTLDFYEGENHETLQSSKTVVIAPPRSKSKSWSPSILVLDDRDKVTFLSNGRLMAEGDGIAVGEDIPVDTRDSGIKSLFVRFDRAR